MAPNPFSPIDMLSDEQPASNVLLMVDKSPMPPQRKFSGNDLYGIKLPSQRSLDSTGSKPKKKKKKKTKSVDPLGSSSHSGDGATKRKKKRGDSKKATKRKSKKKDAMSQSAHAPSSKNDDDVEFPLNDIIPPDHPNSPLRLPNSRRRQKAIPSRHGSLKRNNSVPTMTGSDSDGDSTLEGSWDDGKPASFNGLAKNESPRKLRRNSGKSRVPSEIEAFLDKIIIDAKIDKKPIASIRKKARGRSNSARSKKQQNDSTNKRPELQRPQSDSKLKVYDDDDDDDDNSPKPPTQQRCNSEDRVVSLSIAGQEKRFTLSGADIGVIEAFLLAKDTSSNSSPQPSRAKVHSTSASRAAKRAELFQDRSPSATGKRRSLSNSKSPTGGGKAIVVKRRSLSTSKSPVATRTAGVLAAKRRSLSASGRPTRRESFSDSRNDYLLDSERMDTGNQQTSVLPKAKQPQPNRFSPLQSPTQFLTPQQRPRSMSADRLNSRNFHDMHESRMELLDLETISDEGSYSLSTRKSNVRRWSLSDSMSSSHRLQQLQEEKRQQMQADTRFSKKGFNENGPFSMVKVPRKGRKPATAAPEKNLSMNSMAGLEASKRNVRAGGKMRTKIVDDDGEDDDIYDSPGVLNPAARRLAAKERLITDEEASNIENSRTAHTMEKLMMTPTKGYQRVGQRRGSRELASPSGSRVYAQDLGEARWTTTPTTRLHGKNLTEADPLELHLPFDEDDMRSPGGILKNSYGMVEPSTFRKSSIRNMKRIKRKGIEEGDILLCDGDNASVVSEITEAFFDTSFQTTMSASARSNGDMEDFEEPLRDKWEPDFDHIAETNSQAEFTDGEFSAASPSDLKEDDVDEEESPITKSPATKSPATPKGTKKFAWMKKLPFAKKK